MTAAPLDLLAAALRRPQTLTTLTLAEWDMLVPRARQARLLARIASMIDAQGCFESIPEAPRAHLRAAVLRTEVQHADLMRELDQIGRAFAQLGLRPLLVGGAAYVAAGTLPAMGRELSAVRLLVPTVHLGPAEAALMAHGWTTAHHPLDQRQFHRRWLGGPAPLLHVQRHSVVLLRQTALPGRVGRALTADTLEATALPLEHDARFATPGPVDMALCALAQSYCGGDPDSALRDLSDLDLLLRHVGRGSDFWSELPRRAGELGLARPLRHGIRWATEILGTPIAPAVSEAATRRPLASVVSSPLGDAIWASALRPRPATASTGWTALVRSAFRCRALRLRLPLLALLRHLSAAPSKRAG